MSQTQEFSEEFLNAFVDNQLDATEKARAYQLLSDSEEFNRRVCELRKVRDLVQLAYRDVSTLTPRRPRRPAGVSFGALAQPLITVVLLVLGVTLGWSLRTSVLSDGLFAATPRTTTLAQQRSEVKVLFHLNSGRRQRMREVLDEAQNLLQLYRRQGQRAEVEIVANGKGIDLLRRHHSPYASRIHEMHETYANLTFAACQNTIDRMAREQGIRPHLLPDVTIVDSGVAQIIRLQQRGWTYIRV